jgi:hypothetical protein
MCSIVTSGSLHFRWLHCVYCGFNFSKLPHTYKHYSKSCTHNTVHPQKKQSSCSNCSEIIKVRLANTPVKPTPVALHRAAGCSQIHHNRASCCILFMKSDEQCHCFWKVFSPFYISEIFLSHIVPCLAGVKTLFKLSFNPTLTPLPFNFQRLHSFTVMKRSHYEKRE